MNRHYFFLVPSDFPCRPLTASSPARGSNGLLLGFKSDFNPLGENTGARLESNDADAGTGDGLEDEPDVLPLFDVDGAGGVFFADGTEWLCACEDCRWITPGPGGGRLTRLGRCMGSGRAMGETFCLG